jgi:hypothetical protein
MKLRISFTRLAFAGVAMVAVAGLALSQEPGSGSPKEGVCPQPVSNTETKIAGTARTPSEGPNLGCFETCYSECLENCKARCDETLAGDPAAIQRCYAGCPIVSRCGPICRWRCGAMSASQPGIRLDNAVPPQVGAVLFQAPGVNRECVRACNSQKRRCDNRCALIVDPEQQQVCLRGCEDLETNCLARCIRPPFPI